MLQRILFGTFALTAVFAVALLDAAIALASRETEGPWGELLRRGSVIPVVWLALCLAGAVELSHILRLKDLRPHTGFAYVMITVLILTPWTSAAGWMGHGAAQVEGTYWLVIGLLVAGVGTGVLALFRGGGRGSLRDIGATYLMILYVGFLGAFALQLRCAREPHAAEGAWLLLILIVVTKFSDIGAYFVGSRWGRHKLCPTVSPGKSIEGAIGGLCVSALLAAAVVGAHAAAGHLGPSAPMLVELPSRSPAVLVYNATRAFSLEYHPGGIPPMLRAALFGLVVSAAGQTGDLVESCFKRDAGIKDSGHVLPRFGGILDLMDSPLFAVPVGWFVLTALWSVV